MTIDRIREVHLARPFQPFVMHMADGKTLRVTHPESLAYNPTGRTAVYVAPSGSTHFVDLLLVARLEIDNGRPRRRPKP
jgi:hypothetical protein